MFASTAANGSEMRHARPRRAGRSRTAGTGSGARNAARRVVGGTPKTSVSSRRGVEPPFDVEAAFDLVTSSLYIVDRDLRVVVWNRL